jgi:methyl-accepting chemotaxis protein
MTIKFKLTVNVILLLLIVAVVAGAGVVAMGFVRTHLTNLTERSTPFQVKTLEFQKSLQASIGTLVKVSIAPSLEVFQVAQTEARHNLDELKEARKQLDAITSDRSKEDAAAEIASVARQLFDITENRLKAENAAYEANTQIHERLNGFSSRLRELDVRVKALQARRAASLNASVAQAKTVNQRLRAIELLQSQLKDLQLLIFEIENPKGKRALLITRGKVNSALQQTLGNEAVGEVKGAANDLKLVGDKLAEMITTQTSLLDKPDPEVKARYDTASKVVSEQIAYIRISLETQIRSETEKFAAETKKQTDEFAAAEIANAAMAENYQLALQGGIIETLVTQILLARTGDDIIPLEKSLRATFERVTAIRAALTGNLKVIAAKEELAILQSLEGALVALKAGALDQGGIISRIRTRIEMNARAEKATANLRTIVDKQSAKGRQSVSAAQEEQEQAIQSVNRVVTVSVGAIIAVSLIAALVAILFGIGIGRSVLGPLNKAVEFANGIAAGKLDHVIEPRGHSEMTTLMVALKTMQQNLHERIEADHRSAQETLRVKIALDNVSTGVMIGDTGGLIIYSNPAAGRVVGGRGEAGILGTPLRDFWARATEAVSGASNGPVVDSFERDGHHFLVTANPVISPEGKNLGTVAEWRDRTGEVKAQQEINAIVTAAAAGDFAKRLALEGKEGFFLDVATGLNRLAEVTSAGLSDVAAVLRCLAQGDLTHTIDSSYDGVFAQLKTDTNTTVMQLRQVMTRIRDASSNINTAAHEISAGNADLSRRTEKQSFSLQTTTHSMDDLNATVGRNATDAERARTLAKESNDAAAQGGEKVMAIVHTMGGIQDSSKKIADIIGVIDSLAFQTNILALNAAVEAARAGEQGRGFAVVATEVRTLAQRSATAAREIRTLILDSVSRVEDGVKLVDAAGLAMDRIVSSANEVAELVSGIANASREQSDGIARVTTAIADMDAMTQENASMVEEAAAAAASLDEQARGLVEQLTRFRINNTAGKVLTAATGSRTPSQQATSAHTTKRIARPALPPGSVPAAA